jgi:catechol 2,3-dioxygenase-like lactoylglutathione lyase family enzyme
MWSNVAAHPSPTGDWAMKPTRTRSAASPVSEKYRSSRHHAPSAEAWKAQAAPTRVTRSHKVRPSTSKELQSSEMPLVTTVTALGTSCAEYSKQHLAQCRSLACSSSTPASYMLPNSTLTSAVSVKSPAGGKPTKRPASGSCSNSRPAGSMNRSVLAAAVRVSTPCCTRQPDAGLPAGSSGNGKLGNFNAATWVVCHDTRIPSARAWLGPPTGSETRELHVAFRAPDRAAVDAVHEAAVAAGVEVLHAPREFPEYHPGYYGVFLRDPDGHNFEAVHHG